MRERSSCVKEARAYLLTSAARGVWGGTPYTTHVNIATVDRWLHLGVSWGGRQPLFSRSNTSPRATWGNNLKRNTVLNLAHNTRRLAVAVKGYRCPHPRRVAVDRLGAAGDTLLRGAVHPQPHATRCCCRRIPELVLADRKRLSAALVNLVPGTRSDMVIAMLTWMFI